MCLGYTVTHRSLFTAGFGCYSAFRSFFGAKKKIEDHLWTTSLDDIIELFAVPKSTAEKMREAYRNIKVPDGIKSFGDEMYIKTLTVKKVLVTTGFKSFQEDKIAKLGMTKLFDEIIVDALDNREKRKGKKKIFQELLEKNNWKNNEVLVVGDNPLSELGAAQALGITTIQTLRPNVVRWPEADYHIVNFEELQRIISSREECKL